MKKTTFYAVVNVIPEIQGVSSVRLHRKFSAAPKDAATMVAEQCNNPLPEITRELRTSREWSGDGFFTVINTSEEIV